MSEPQDSDLPEDLDVSSAESGIIDETEASDVSAVPVARTTRSDGAASTDGSHSVRDSTAQDLPTIEGYLVQREIASGGMGRVLAAFDVSLQRDVALKVLLPGSSSSRFVRESRITARLPHPGIPPVHALGHLADGSPFLVMKLIAGRTLAEEIKHADRPRLLQVFAQVCQAVGFAHSRGVIHRDLKPANVMVGAFGEVQVMDWGLAKDSNDQDFVIDWQPTPAPADKPAERATNATLDLGLAEENDFLTAAGAVMGTPAYMAPEQARGETVDARSDVFALGGILYAILTGEPPFKGKSIRDVIRRAGAAELGTAYSRLVDCGAEQELVAICRRCLSPSAAARPQDGQAVADSLIDYLDGVQQRLQAAERNRAVAVVREAEMRKRRRVQWALVMAVGLLTIGGCAIAGWQIWQTNEHRTAELRRQLQFERLATLEAGRRGRNAEAVDGLLERTHAALRAGDAPQAALLIDEATKRSAEDGAAEYRTQIAAYRAEVQALLDLDAAEQFRWNAAASGRFDVALASEQRRTALRTLGADPDESDPAAVAAYVADSAIRVRLITALDRQLWFNPSENIKAALRIADPEPYRDAFRDAVVAGDELRMTELANDPRALALPSGFAASLSESNRVPAPRRREVLKSAISRYPSDWSLLMDLGVLFPCYEPLTEDERLIWFQAAVAASPKNSAAWNNLAATLLDWREFDRAEAAIRESIRLDPANADAFSNLGGILMRQQDPDGAEAAFREALRLNPDDPIVKCNWAALSQLTGKLEEAAAVCREVIEQHPDCVEAHSTLGYVLLDQGDAVAAEAAHRRALELRPHLASSHHGLGNALSAQADVPGAEAAYREALRLNPRIPDAHVNLGFLLREIGRLAESEACHREAIRLEPDLVSAHNGLGNTLRDMGNLPEAIECFEEAIRLNPQHAPSYNNLGIALAMAGELDSSVTAFEKSLRLEPGDQGTLQNLGNVRQLQAQRDASVRLAAYREGNYAPTDNEERLRLLKLCGLNELHLTATRLAAEIFAADPLLADDRSNTLRYNAASHAALAASGRGIESARLDEAAKGRLRQQALEWLRADLNAWAKQQVSGQLAARTQARQALQFWIQDRDLHSLRDTGELTQLPEDQREAFTQLWSDVSDQLALPAPESKDK